MEKHVRSDYILLEIVYDIYSEHCTQGKCS